MKAIKRLFLASKIRLYILVQSLMMLSMLGISALADGFSGWLFLPVLLSGVVSLYFNRYLAYPMEAIEKIKSVLNDMHEGRYSSRITNVPWMGEIGLLAWSLNESLDQLETYFREIDTSFELVSRGQYYRRTLPDGLQGDLVGSLERINVSLDAMIENAQYIKRNEMASELQALNTSQTMANLTLNQNDLIKITEEMDTVAAIATDNTDKASRSQETIEQVVASQTQTLEMIEKGNETMARLHQMSGEITGVLGMISEIADKTNLLALNASIEAARAGEHGRGFAVVADEVKQLASNTKAATDEIHKVVTTFARETETMQGDSTVMVEMARKVQGVVEEMHGKFAEFAEQASVTNTTVGRSRDICFASLVKVDHMIYKQKAYAAFYKGTDTEEAQAIGVDYHDCRLGKWYYQGRGLELFSQLHSYPELEQPHAGVHQSAYALIEEIGQDWQADAALQQSILGHYREMEAASDAVMEKIDTLVMEKHQQA